MACFHCPYRPNLREEAEPRPGGGITEPCVCYGWWEKAAAVTAPPCFQPSQQACCSWASEHQCSAGWWTGCVYSRMDVLFVWWMTCWCCCRLEPEPHTDWYSCLEGGFIDLFLMFCFRALKSPKSGIRQCSSRSTKCLVSPPPPPLLLPLCWCVMLTSASPSQRSESIEENPYRPTYIFPENYDIPMKIKGIWTGRLNSTNLQLLESYQTPLPTHTEMLGCNEELHLNCWLALSFAFLHILKAEFIFIFKYVVLSCRTWSEGQIHVWLPATVQLFLCGGGSFSQRNS